LKSNSAQGILYLENFPIENAGYQYRVAKWAEILRKKGYRVEIWTLIEGRKEFEEKMQDNVFTKFLIFNLYKRFCQVLASKNYKTVIVRRELLWFNDYGNLFLEKLLLKMHPNAILDFDDDISAAKNQPKKITNWFGKIMCENGNKFNDSLRLYKKFIVASEYLKEKVIKENLNIMPNDICVIPTCVDYAKYDSKDYSKLDNSLTIGWIGGNHNYSQLERVVPILNELSKKYKFNLLVIAGFPPLWDVNFNIKFIRWGLDSEIENLLKIDIGIMPLDSSRVSKGKAGFKLIQYMGLGIVSIADAITVNKGIVSNSVDSFLAVNEEDWRIYLENILENKYDLMTMSKDARKKISQNFSFKSHFESYSHFINGYSCVG